MQKNHSTVLLIDSGGLSHYTSYLAVGLSRYREIILCGYSDELYSLTGAEKEKRIKFHNMGKWLPKGNSLLSSAIRPYLMFFPLVKALVISKYDIVHIQGYSYLFFLFVPFIKLRKKPICWTIHDVDFRPTNSGMRGKLESLQVRLLCQNRWLAKKVNGIIVHGLKLKDKLVSRGICESKVLVVPHFDYRYLLTLSSKIDAGITNGEYVLLFGKLKPYKGIEILLDASRLVRKKMGKKFKLMIAGKGSESYWNISLNNTDREYISLRNGYVPELEIPSLFKKAKFLVLPYIDASQSGVVSLAYTFSKPVIVSNVGSISEFVDDGVTGLIFESGNTTQLAKYMEELVECVDRCKEMGNNGYQKILNGMSLEKCSFSINEFYNRLNTIK